MNIPQQIEAHIAGEPQSKRSDLQALHDLMRRVLPKGRLWFDTGKNSEGKTVCNPTIGYGLQVLKYANGSTKDFFQVGLSTNTTGISVYIMGLKDKAYLAKTYGKQLGKASVTGYCIKFKALKDIDVDVFESAIRYGIEATKVS